MLVGFILGFVIGFIAALAWMLYLVKDFEIFN